MTTRIRCGVLTILLGVALGGPAYAKMRSFTMLELAEQSDVAFTGKVTVVDKDAAIVTVDEVLSGKLSESTVSLTPLHIRHCTGTSLNFSVDEQVLVFGKRTGEDRVTVAADGQGKIRLTPETQKTEIPAARHLLILAPLEKKKKNDAMLNLVRSQNERLRSEARHHVVSTISQSKLRDQYKDDLVAMIGDTDPEIQQTGLQGIRFVQAQAAIPRMAELSRSENLDVVSAASEALGQYDAPESVAALIALTRHENPQIRMRAGIDIDQSRRPEAKEALKQLLYDKDPKVRAIGPRGLVYWLRREEAADVLPRLVEMLDDAASEVRASAAEKLGECRNSELVPPLITALKNAPQDENIKRCILNALYCHYSKGDSKAKELIDKSLEPIVAALKTGGPTDDYGPSFQAVGILSLSQKVEARNALEWAARSHPNKEIQAYAQRSLSN